ncbi:MAG: flagellin FliC5 [Lachnospiraceae bacterium]|nr:flagellin FliC5 [Lachnospiraceae bacterium]
MSGISGVSSTYSYGSYAQIASGKRINTAADDAAGLAIAEEENSYVNGLNAGSNNMESAKDMLNISDSAASSITDYLQRIKELSVQASNSALMSSSDLKKIQDEIDQLKQGISDVASQTTYNTHTLLDGTDTDYELATNAEGSTTTVSTGNMTLEALGIADYDVTGDFDMSVIDDAIEAVSSQRSSMGAQSNALEYAVNVNNTTAYNATSTLSRIEDLDYPQAIEERKKQEALQAYSLMMQKKEEEEEQRRSQNLFTTSI